MNSILEMLKKPLVIGITAFALGLTIGLVLLGWYVFPVEWVDASPDLLNADYQRDYMRMIIDSLRVNGDQPLAIDRYQSLGSNAPDRLQDLIDDSAGQDLQILEIFQSMVADVDTGAKPKDTDSGSTSSLGTYLVIGAVIGLVAVLAAVLFYIFKPNKRRGDPTPQQQALDLSRSVEKTDYVAQGTATAPPIAQFVTTYVLGDDLFDDSFSIDSPTGEFLGECGVGISETIGVGEPKKVTAFEVWMFDKNDIQTVTKVFMSAHAFGEPGIRAKLESKGELINIDGKQAILETQTLRMIATISDMAYGQGPLPVNSYYDRMTLELAIWQK
jgi:hypothetical protein